MTIVSWEFESPPLHKENSYFAAIAQLVEHNLAKVGVASSSLVCRSIKGHTGRRNGGIGRHEGLKIPWPVMAVRVRVPLAAQREYTNNDIRWTFQTDVHLLLLYKTLHTFIYITI